MRKRGYFQQIYGAVRRDCRCRYHALQQHICGCTGDGRVGYAHSALGDCRGNPWGLSCGEYPAAIAAQKEDGAHPHLVWGGHWDIFRAVNPVPQYEVVDGCHGRGFYAVLHPLCALG